LNVTLFTAKPQLTQVAHNVDDLHNKLDGVKSALRRAISVKYATVS
jgi:hypothetical protein